LFPVSALSARCSPVLVAAQCGDAVAQNFLCIVLRESDRIPSIRGLDQDPNPLAIEEYGTHNDSPRRVA